MDVAPLRSPPDDAALRRLPYRTAPDMEGPFLFFDEERRATARESLHAEFCHFEVAGYGHHIGALVTLHARTGGPCRYYFRFWPERRYNIPHRENWLAKLLRDPEYRRRWELGPHTD